MKSDQVEFSSTYDENVKSSNKYVNGEKSKLSILSDRFLDKMFKIHDFNMKKLYIRFYIIHFSQLCIVYIVNSTEGQLQ